MKNLFLTVVLLLSMAFSATAAPYVYNTAIDAALTTITTNATAVHYVTGTLPANYAAVVANDVASATVSGVASDTCAVGAESFDLTDGDVSGRKLTLCAMTGFDQGGTGDGTLLGNGVVTFGCLVSADTLLLCFDVTGAPEIVDYTSETWDTAAVDVWEIRAIQTTP